MPRTSSLVAVGRSLLAGARREQLSLLAAAIAYYAFVSTVPLAILAFTVAATVGGEAFATAVVAGFEDLLSPEAATLLESALVSSAGRGGATLVGLVVLAWSGLRVFRGLDLAFSRLYGGSDPETLVEQVRDGGLVLGAIAVALGVEALTVLVLPGLVPVAGHLVGPIVTALALPVAFFPVYYVFPDRDVAVREAIPGALFAGLGWTVLAWLFAVYAANAGTYEVYGLVGGVLLVLTWYYAGGLVILVGALLNVVLAEGGTDRQVQGVALRDGGQRQSMAEDDGANEDDTPPVESVDTRDVDPQELADLREEVEDLAEDLESKTRNREDLESDLRQYVRWRQRRGHARGWGPYLVLLYGTLMTVGAFYYLDGGWAILAMLVIWLSTLGLYTLMLVVGLVGTAVGLPGKVADRLRNVR